MAAPASPAPPEVLVLEHDEAAPPALLGDTLAAAGVTVRVVRLWAGEPLPGPGLDGAAGLVVLGGPMGANDDADVAWVGPLKGLLREVVAARTPVLGVCLGHQLLAAALGGEVVVSPRGQRVGVLEVGWLPEAAHDPLLGPLVAGAHRGVQWNRDVVATLPAGAAALARLPDGDLQAARFAPAAWGVQLHPEADRPIVESWARGDRADHLERGIDHDGALEGIGAAAAELRGAWSPLGGAFAGLVLAAVQGRRGGA